uniref:Uncharacterized protein n=1 Tax=Kalanchoe fedtschenkoi TaxID=63787 RepID=A0A7N0U1U5_KALFE
MVRGKTEMKRIENATSRQVTFSKRRNGLLKKAFELSVLCEAEVALIVFSTRGKLFEFSNSTSGMRKTIDRYEKKTKGNDTKGEGADKHADPNMDIRDEISDMERQIEKISSSQRKLKGEDVESLSINELIETEEQLEQSLSRIRAKKNELLRDQIQKLKQEEKEMLEENVRLRKEARIGSGKPWQQKLLEQLPSPEKSDDCGVETELFIGLPEMRRSRR